VVFTFDVSGSLAENHVVRETHNRIRQYLAQIVFKGWDGVLRDGKDKIVASPVDNTLAAPLLAPNSTWSAYHFGDTVYEKQALASGSLDQSTLDALYPKSFPDQNTLIPKMYEVVCGISRLVSIEHRQLFWVYVSDDIPDLGSVATKGDPLLTLLAQRYYCKPLLSVRVNGYGTAYTSGPSAVFVQVSQIIDQQEQTPPGGPSDAYLNDLQKRQRELEEALRKLVNRVPSPQENELRAAIAEETHKVYGAFATAKEVDEGKQPFEKAGPSRKQYESSGAKAKGFADQVVALGPASFAADSLNVLNMQLEILKAVLERIEVRGNTEGLLVSLIEEFGSKFKKMQAKADSLLASLTTVQNGEGAATAKAGFAEFTKDFEVANGTLERDIIPKVASNNSTSEKTKALLAEVTSLRDDVKKKIDEMKGRFDEIAKTVSDAVTKDLALQKNIAAVGEKAKRLQETAKNMLQAAQNGVREGFLQLKEDAKKLAEDLKALSASVGADGADWEKSRAEMQRVEGGLMVDVRATILKIEEALAGWDKEHDALKKAIDESAASLAKLEDRASGMLAVVQKEHKADGLIQLKTDVAKEEKNVGTLRARVKSHTSDSDSCGTTVQGLEDRLKGLKQTLRDIQASGSPLPSKVLGGMLLIIVAGVVIVLLLNFVAKGGWGTGTGAGNTFKFSVAVGQAGPPDYVTPLRAGDIVFLCAKNESQPKDKVFDIGAQKASVLVKGGPLGLNFWLQAGMGGKLSLRRIQLGQKIGVDTSGMPKSFMIQRAKLSYGKNGGGKPNSTTRPTNMSGQFRP
jgi:hypothetical protein